MKSALIHVLFLLFEICVFGDADKAETVSVIEGDSVTLHTGVTEIQRDDEIEWRLNDNRIAIISGDDIITEGSSRDRLMLDKQTGDLKITNINTTDSGEYKLQVVNTRGSSEKTFSVRGVSGVDEVKSVSVIVGDSVTLNSGTIIQRDDVIEWRFLNSPIAEHNRKTGNFSTSDGPDGRFRHRLKLDPQTGSLTIRKTGTEHSGDYEAGIRKSSSKHTIHKSYNVTVGELKSVSVMKGDSVTLQTGLTEIQRDDLMLWMFEDTVLAEIYKAQNRFLTSDGPDERFRDRLELNKKTGSLTITDTTTEDAGDYKLQTNIIRFTINKRITVTVTGELKSALSVKKGESVTLNSSLTEIQTDDSMQWMFGETVLAEIYKAGDRFFTSAGPDERFRDRLKLDHQTGSLNITDTKFTDSGLYELKISSIRRTVLKRFTVIVTDPGLSTGAIAGICVGVVVLLAYAAAVAGVGVIYYRREISELVQAWIYKRTILSVMEGESITLKPDDTEVHKDDTLLWMIRGACIAERESAALGFTVHDDVPDGRFEGRLKPDHPTGSLTITNTRTTDTGQYELVIIRSGNVSINRFSVSVFAQSDDIKTVSVKEGGSVTLETGVTDIQKDDEIQWKFGLNIRLAEITRGAKIISPIADKILKVKLELDHQTGSLTIKKIRPTDAGIYMLRKIERGKIKTKLFRVEVSDSTNNRNNPEDVPLNSVL